VDNDPEMRIKIQRSRFHIFRLIQNLRRFLCAGKGIPAKDFQFLAASRVNEYDMRKTHDTPLRNRKMPRCTIRHHAGVN